MDNNLLGEQIAKYRKAAGLTQDELGKGGCYSDNQCERKSNRNNG